MRNIPHEAGTSRRDRQPPPSPGSRSRRTRPPSTSAAVAPDSTVTAADSRAGALVKPTQAQADAVAAIVKASPGTRATWDARFGTPRTLTPALGEDADRAAGPAAP